MDVFVHFGFTNAALGIQELEDDDEQDQETGGGPLKHGAGEAEEITHPYRHPLKNMGYRISFSIKKNKPIVPL